MGSFSINHQRGVVLIVSLVMLLIITLVGVASMQSSTMQERMAANSKQKLTSQLAAESALKAAEEYLQTQGLVTDERLSTVFYPVDGHYTFRSVSSVLPVKLLNFDVDDPSEWTDNNSIEVDDLTAGSVAKMPRYVIEFIGSDVVGVNNNAKEIPEAYAQPEPHFFRVTAIGWAQDSKIFTVLESSFMSTP